MLTNAKTLKGYKFKAIDGEIGSVKEFFFDDNFWTIRYLVANTGGWLSNKQVLISPYFIKRVSYGTDLIEVDLTKNQIENSPPLESDLPVSRQFEESYYGYYEAPVYWSGPNMWGTEPGIIRDRERWRNIGHTEHAWDPNLHSSKDVTGHDIKAVDDKIGHVDDFIIDDDSWAIRYLVVDTKNFLPGKKVLVSPQWIERISWEDANVVVNLSTDLIKRAPEYDERNPVTRDYESRLFDYYDRKGYWMEQPVSREYHHHR